MPILSFLLKLRKTILIIITKEYLVIFQVTRECHGFSKNRLVSWQDLQVAFCCIQQKSYRVFALLSFDSISNI